MVGVLNNVQTNENKIWTNLRKNSKFAFFFPYRGSKFALRISRFD